MSECMCGVWRGGGGVGLMSECMGGAWEGVRCGLMSECIWSRGGGGMSLWVCKTCT